MMTEEQRTPNKNTPISFQSTLSRADYFNDLGGNRLHLAYGQLPGTVKNDFGIGREQAIWTHITLSAKSSRRKIAFCNVNGKIISDGAPGDLTEHHIIARS